MNRSKQIAATPIEEAVAPLPTWAQPVLPSTAEVPAECTDQLYSQRFALTSAIYGAAVAESELVEMNRQREASAQLAATEKLIAAIQQLEVVRSHNSNANAASASKVLLTASDVAALYDVDARTVRNWAATGKLPRPVKIGRAVRWRRADLKGI
jgi:predicted DNA-binding transcriptional regulator AlpA